MHTSIAGGAKETMQNILVVEDDRELNEALCYALKKQDYHTSTAFSADNKTSRKKMATS